ncbi:MAG: MBL fold metallo-hydrolase [Acidobacteria bacterium]|nr:MAG: MBL fold metallo-hydrolase [Acidobacteriota bacterium]REK11532.1 MAG: MBL fold metallo-hydrolase [Acidobacteriota bacterium]
MSRPFASSADLDEKRQTLDELAPGVWALTSEGDPNIGAIEGEEFVVAFEARATPVAARPWVEELGRRTGGKPIRYLVLSHYHAVRVLGAAAFDPQTVVAHHNTARLVEERGREDWASELGRMPRLFEDPDSIPGLTRPTLTFTETLEIQLGGERGALRLQHLGRGHTAGDLVAWLPERRILFAGDLVEAEAALYTGDAFHREWAGPTLDRLIGLQPDVLIGGRGPVVHGASACRDAVAQTRRFLTTMIRRVDGVRRQGGTLKQAFDEARAALAPSYGAWPIFEHCMPFNVARLWDELSGTSWPRIWTAERDREVWDLLQD